MAANTYGVTYATVAARLTTVFSAATAITDTFVTSEIARKAATVAGIASAKGIVTEDMPSTANAYPILADMLLYMVCADIAQAMSRGEAAEYYAKSSRDARDTLLKIPHMVMPESTRTDISETVTAMASRMALDLPTATSLNLSSRILAGGL